MAVSSVSTSFSLTVDSSSPELLPRTNAMVRGELCSWLSPTVMLSMWNSVVCVQCRAVIAQCIKRSPGTGFIASEDANSLKHVQSLVGLSQAEHQQ